MKVLVVTAAFAPRGASAAVRTVNLVKYLARAGHSVRVVTYEEKALTLFSPADASLSAKVPSEVQVFRVPAGLLRRRLMRTSTSGGTATAAKSRLMRNPLVSLLIPDPQVDAVPAFIREGSRLIDADPPDVLVTHGYPFSTHVAGALLKRRHPGVRWVADYGDPWSGGPLSELPRPRWREWLDYRLESWLLGHADRVTVTTEPTLALYERLFPFLHGRVHLAPMGFDPEDFATIEPLSRGESEREEFWLVHTGRLYSEARDPRTFFRALDRLRPEQLRRLRIILVGEAEEGLRREIGDSTAKDVVRFVPWVPVAESIAWMKTADCLLLFGNREGVQVPGKVYQYLGAGKPILLLSLFDHDPTIPIALHAAGSVVAPNDESRISMALGKLLAARTRPPERVEAAERFAWPKIVRALLAGMDVPAGHR